MNDKRWKFLTQACPNIVFALFGLSYLEACSSAKDDDQNIQVDSNNNNSSGESSGITTQGNNVNIDLSNGNFTSLESIGGNINVISVGLLLLRTGENQVLAFDNCCPHQGSRQSWSFSENKWTCSSHGNSYGIDGEDVVSCDSNSRSGGLKSYPTSIDGNLLTINKG